MDKSFFEVEENTNVTEPLVDIHVPEGQEVTLGPLSTPFAFRIQGNQLFLNVSPDYEVWAAGGWGVGAPGRRAPGSSGHNFLGGPRSSMPAGIH